MNQEQLYQELIVDLYSRALNLYLTKNASMLKIEWSPVKWIKDQFREYVKKHYETLRTKPVIGPWIEQKAIEEFRKDLPPASSLESIPFGKYTDENTSLVRWLTSIGAGLLTATTGSLMFGNKRKKYRITDEGTIEEEEESEGFFPVWPLFLGTLVGAAVWFGYPHLKQLFIGNVKTGQYNQLLKSGITLDQYLKWRHSPEGIVANWGKGRLGYDPDDKSKLVIFTHDEKGREVRVPLIGNRLDRRHVGMGVEATDEELRAAGLPTREEIKRALEASKNENTSLAQSTVSNTELKPTTTGSKPITWKHVGIGLGVGVVSGLIHYLLFNRNKKKIPWDSILFAALSGTVGALGYRLME